ncbi:DNA repair helicase-like protein, partial [Dinothrombium tinctorium]
MPNIQCPESNVIRYSGPHVIPRENCVMLPFGETSSDDEILLSGAATSTQDKCEQQLLKVNSVIRDCVQRFDASGKRGGIAVFFTSYARLESFRKATKIDGNSNVTFMGRKCFFEQKESAAEKFNSIELQIDESDREDPDDASSQSNYLSSLLESYKQAIDNEGTAFLFAVFRGSLAEGIDFSDDYCRLLFVVGMPFISPVCDEYDDMKHFLQQRHGKSDGARRASEWYMVQMKQALNQVLGRVLRHRRDF